MGKKVTRLYTQFQPEHYDLFLHPNRDDMVFGGTVTIRGKKVGRPTERLTFHQKGLKITKAAITKHDKNGDKGLDVVRINTQATFDEVRLHVDGKILPGEYTVTIEFEAAITKPMNGIYPCFYTHEGKAKQIQTAPLRWQVCVGMISGETVDAPDAKKGL